VGWRGELGAGFYKVQEEGEGAAEAVGAGSGGVRH
jgi:hypothetical protein